jgi:hypothetical protein
MWTTAELGRMLVNHKRVARIMQEDNLPGVQPRAFVVTTGDSRYEPAGELPDILAKWGSTR